jgi:type III secretion protein J
MRAHVIARSERVRARRLLLLCLLAAMFGCRSAVRADLDEDQANELLVALHASGIGATKVREAGASAGRFRVEVPDGALGRALRVLKEQGLPRRELPGFDALYAGTGLLPTPSDERARWLAAASSELARSLSRLPGVLDARVHVAAPRDAQALDDPPPPRQASVVLQVAEAATFDDAAVQRLVAAAIDGLDAAQVEVVRVTAQARKAQPVRLVQVGPADVSAESAPALRTLLVVALVLEIVLAGALVVVWRSRR